MDWLVELIGEPNDPQTGKPRRGWVLGFGPGGILMDGPGGILREVPLGKCRFAGMIAPGTPTPVFMVPPPDADAGKPDLLIMKGQHLKEEGNGQR